MLLNPLRISRPSRIALTAIAFCAIASVAWADTSAPAGSAPTGPKKSVAVAGFDGSISFEGGDAAQGLTTMLADALIRDGRFVVVERAAIADVSAEHDRATGSATAATQLTPANVLVRGTVTKFIPKAGGGGLSAGFMGGGSLGGALGVSGDHSDVEINLRLIDVATGRILSSTNVQGSASSQGVTANVYTKSGMTFGGNEFSSSPLGQACEQAIAGAIDQIASALDNVAWSAQVLSSDTGQIYIDAGSIQNIQVGETFKIYHKDKVLTDPATGAVIDVLETPVGSISIVSVRDKTSAGTVTAGALPARGDIVRVN